MAETLDPSASEVGARAGLDQEQADALADGRHASPFAVLGRFADGDDASIVRTFQPQAASVTLLAGDGRRVEMTPHGNRGLFVARVAPAVDDYRLELEEPGGPREIVDAYALSSAIGEIDRHLFNEGTHQQLYRILGSHAIAHAGHDGVHFAIWAPNARRVSVVGEFNGWDGRRHVMRAHPGSGLWDVFVPGLGEGTLYKYELVGAEGELLPLKNDPYANYFEQAPGNASIVFRSRFGWSDGAWMEATRGADMRARPMTIYEAHPGSWARHEDGRVLAWPELADRMIPYLVENAYTHVELLPVTEHPFDGSWGYQPVGLYAPTSRFGSPDDFRQFVDRCHGAGIGVIMDWVPAHFPTDEHGLGRFDGTALYEHADPRQGFHQDWNTLIFNYGRREVANYLLSNAVYWIREFHLDGLRVDAVASMLYLDYSRKDGEWIPNRHGGRENLEAIDFLKRMNELVHAEGGITLAEESTSFPRVSHPTWADGLGFTFKWNMGWMHDVLEYMSKDPAWRKYHQDKLTFGMLYAFSENFVLPFSHDEVVHGKGSMINKMPGDDWQKFANLRALYAMMTTWPGKKLNFMGNEFAQFHEWQHAGSLHWHLLDEPRHRSMLELTGALNRLYRDHGALHETDCDGAGFEWIDCSDAEQSVISWYRYSADRTKRLVTVLNFTPIVREGYRIGVDGGGRWTELVNTDDERYGGSGQGNAHGDGPVAEETSAHGRPFSLVLTLPPLAGLVLERAAEG